MERERGDRREADEPSEEEVIVAASGTGGWIEICAADNPRAWVACDEAVEVER